MEGDGCDDGGEDAFCTYLDPEVCTYLDPLGLVGPCWAGDQGQGTAGA